jgi:D-alanyl-lipoteichoic acid acyltransferase DltB (MBOAT superfamily)
MNSDGTDRVKIADNAREPCWSADGKSVAHLKGEFEKYNLQDFATRGVYILVSFFPQLVAGPIERASNLLPQLQGTPKITGQDLADGLSLFVVVFFKKVALAD